MTPKIGVDVVAPFFSRHRRYDFCHIYAETGRRSFVELAVDSGIYDLFCSAHLDGTKDLPSTREKKDLVPSIFIRSTERFHGTIAGDTA